MSSNEANIRVRADKLSWRQVGDEVVVLDLERGIYLAISASGVGLWEMLSSGATPRVLENHLIESYDLDPEHAAQDVDSFLVMLRDAELVE